MKFNKLAELFSKLEATTKRLEMIDILANFFSTIKNNNEIEDLDKIIYLLQGQLVSNIKQFPKMGIAEKMILEALVLISGMPKVKLKEYLKKSGDIGSTSEFALKNKKQKALFDSPKSLEISKLYSELEKIALAEGVGSHKTEHFGKKIGTLRDLIFKCSPVEAKYLVRIIMSTLRMGVSTMTIIDGIAEGFMGKKEGYRDIIERAYNLHPDLGDITLILAKNGLKAVQEIDITYGIPIRMMLASRVPYPEIIGKLGSPFVAEYKLDGERLQVHKQGEEIKIFSRRLLEISEQYPDVIDIIKLNVNAKNVIFEGEVVAMDPFYEKMLPFQVLSKRRRKYDVETIAKEVPVCLFVFDLLKFEDESYIEKPLSERRKKLEEIVKERDELRLVNEIKIHSTEELVDYFNKARDEGNEGIMAKSIGEDSIYQAGNRGFLWIKLKGLEGGKLKDSVDVVLIGAFYGKGRRTGVYGTYIGAVYDPENDNFIGFTRFFSGLTDELSESLTKKMKQYIIPKKPNNVICEDPAEVWFTPEIVVEIIGDEITVSEKFATLGYSMRFPVFQRFRDEKGPKDITTVEEIRQLYETQ